uniref:Uncharacterized protein n=1 Tax=Oryza punctata TaxID=4537 RepID=A0A0E0M4N4_ORYPU
MSLSLAQKELFALALPTSAAGYQTIFLRPQGNLKRQGVLLTVPSHKKQTRMVHLSNPSWKGGDQQNSGTSMGDEEDNMDLDLDMMRICAMLHANRFINRSNGARHANVFT